MGLPSTYKGIEHNVMAAPDHSTRVMSSYRSLKRGVFCVEPVTSLGTFYSTAKELSLAVHVFLFLLLDEKKTLTIRCSDRKQVS